MTGNKRQRVLCFALAVLLLFGTLCVSAAADTSSEKQQLRNEALNEMESFLGASSYSDYYAQYHGDVDYTPTAATAQSIDIFDFDSTSVDTKYCDSATEILTDAKDASTDSVYLSASGSVTWKLTMDEAKAGLYFIRISYRPLQSDNGGVSSIERKLYINGKIPFTEANSLRFAKSCVLENAVVTEAPADSEIGIGYELGDNGYVKTRIYLDESTGKKMMETTTISEDINGNSMLPDIETESGRWMTTYLQDSTGYNQGYFEFYFPKGSHTLTLKAEREAILVDSVELVPVNDGSAKILTYAEYQAKYANKSAATTGKFTMIQAEFPNYVSDTSVYPTNDNTSVRTYPVVSNAQLYNVIGENSYSTVGQYAAYNFSVTESGMYKFAMRYKQDALQGMYICRTIKLAGGEYGLADGTPTVPFQEAYDAQFNYDDKWQSSYVGNGDTVFEFYFEKDVVYTVYLECSLGSLKNLIARAEKSLDTINSDYLRILQLTGADPDEYRDYGFEKIMPDVIVSLLDEGLELSAIADEFEELCGTKGSHIATLDTIAELLDRMGQDNGYEIARNLDNLKSNLGTLGTWINDSKKSSMMVDSIAVVSADEDQTFLKKEMRDNAGFFGSLWFEIRSFVSSFFVNYDVMGLTKEPDEDTTTIDVWLASGRDQSQIWRTMVDAKSGSGFTDRTGVAVTLKLVTGGTLLPSILSGKGPDIYLGLGSADVINYAIRDAVLGVNGVDPRLTAEENAIFTTTYYTYRDGNTYVNETTPRTDGSTLLFTTLPFDKVVYGESGISDPAAAGYDPNFVQAAMDTVTLMDVSYGIPMSMSFAMMFYRADVLASDDLGCENIPETWSDLLALLPALQANNMSMGVAYGSAIDFLLYQMGGNMWKYTDKTTYDSKYAGAKIGLDTDIAYESFDYVCRLYTDYSFPVSYDAANRFRTGEMPILIGDYATIYNQLVVFATEIDGLWTFCSLPGWQSDDGSVNYDSLAGIGATVMLHGCDDTLAAWQFMQWQTSAAIQANYGNKMVALIGPSAKYESANVKAIESLSWNATELRAIKDQIANMSSVVNYPGSYIIARYTKFAFLDAKNNGTDPVDALRQYVDAINAEIKRKREEFDLAVLEPDEEAPTLAESAGK